MARILTTEQVAEKLQVKPLTVRKYLRKGLIPGKRLGRGWRIVETDLEMFIRGVPLPETTERLSARGFLKNFPGKLSSEDVNEAKRVEAELEEAKFQQNRLEKSA